VLVAKAPATVWRVKRSRTKLDATAAGQQQIVNLLDSLIAQQPSEQPDQ
jgi:hypothetical protein